MSFEEVKEVFVDTLKWIASYITSLPVKWAG